MKKLTKKEHKRILETMDRIEILLSVFKNVKYDKEGRAMFPKNQLAFMRHLSKHGV